MQSHSAGKTNRFSLPWTLKPPELTRLISEINQNLKSIPSNAIASDAKINYNAILQGNEDYAVIEYKVQLVPTITGHLISNEFEKSTVDANWRGISIENPVVVQTDYGLFDINNSQVST